MNIFVDALRNAVGNQVSGICDEVKFLGTITSTRDLFDTDIEVTVEDDGNVYVINGTTLYEGSNGSYSNLHVYF
jgi:hypothetical protein